MMPNPKLRLAGRILILAGVAVWGVYVVFKLMGSQEPASTFLPFHLAGVIPGAILARWHQIRGFFGRS